MKKRAVLYARVSSDDRKNEGRNLLDLLQKSLQFQWQIVDWGNQVESQTKPFAAIAISFFQNPKYLKLANHMLTIDSGFRQRPIRSFFLFC